MSRPIPERLQWFLDRINQRVYRNDDGCDCEPCKKVLENGIVLIDRHQAQYCYDIECDFTAEGTPLRYFDTKGEVEEFVKGLTEAQ